jgi:hypothetical protein
MNNNINNTNNSFESQLKYFTDHLSNSRFIIDVSKFCGYSEFITIYKDQSLLDLYKLVSLHFECIDIKGLYITNNSQTSNRIPLTEKETIREFISKNQEIVKPIYPVPYPVVYKIYFDDGHVCLSDCH